MDDYSIARDWNITAVEEASWAQADQYGNKIYNIGLQGYDGLVMRRTQQEPKLGVIFGHLEPTSTGKGVWLKPDKREGYGGGTTGPSPASAAPAGAQSHVQAPQTPSSDINEVAEVMKGVRAVYALNKEINAKLDILLGNDEKLVGEVELTASVPSQVTNVTASAPVRKWNEVGHAGQEPLPTPPPDVVHDFDDAEPFNLDDIPFK